jgi:hypothetical protein
LQAVEAKPGDVQVFGLPRYFQQLDAAHALGEADLGRFLPNFSQFITMAGEEQWQDMQIGDTLEGTAFDKPVRLTRRS